MSTSITEHSVEAAGPGDRLGAPPTPDRPVAYLLLMLVLVIAGTVAIFVANRAFAPEMYRTRTQDSIGKALADGKNVAVFDLNVNIREIRNAQIAALPQRPDTVILGASHWQEAHSDLLAAGKLLNIHVHRDYYEDLLAMTEILLRHDKLPRRMIIAIRDNIFTPVDQRRDHLWLPGIPYYRAMAARLGLEQHSHWSTLPTQRLRELVSIEMLFVNVTRWYNADEHPHAATERYFKTMDTLLPGGSIVWSREHRTLFTSERATRLALAAADDGMRHPPVIDPAGIVAVDALLGFLVNAGIDVVLAHPPFNPLFLEKARERNESPYMHGLRRVEAATRRLAHKYQLKTIGSFDPADLGCTASMFIDSEHANPLCLSKVLDQLEPGSSAPRPWMISEAASEVEDAAPMDDLARQKLLILKNARKQVAEANAPAPATPFEVIVAAAAPVAEATDKASASARAPADASGAPTVARARKPAEPTRPSRRVASAAPAEPRDRTIAGQAGTVARHGERVWPGDTHPSAGVRRRSPERAAPRYRELVWPGDASPDGGPRRPSGMQRFSAVDR